MGHTFACSLGAPLDTQGPTRLSRCGSCPKTGLSFCEQAGGVPRLQGPCLAEWQTPCEAVSSGSAVGTRVQLATRPLPLYLRSPEAL